MRLLITRPREDGAETARLLAARGHQALLAPLLEPRFEDGPEPEWTAVEAILATSANGVRALARRTARRDLPLFAVGPQTAEEARGFGFGDVRSADGDAHALAQAAGRWARPGSGLLHACAQDAPGTLAEELGALGFEVRRCPLYSIAPAAELPPDAKTALQNRALDGVLLFSPRTARLFSTLAEGLHTESLAAFCISAATARALASMTFARVAVAPKPNQQALLALLD